MTISLPDWTKMDDLGGLMPSEIRVSVCEFGEDCIAAERKRCADICEAEVMRWLRIAKTVYNCEGWVGERSIGASDCRAVILGTLVRSDKT